MPTPQSIIDIKAQQKGTPFYGIFLLKSLATRKSKNNTDFYTIEFEDKTGRFHSNLFSDMKNTVDSLNEGDIVEVYGKSDEYQGNFSPKIEEVFPLDEATITEQNYLEKLVKSSPENADEMKIEFFNIINSIKNEALRNALLSIFEELKDTFFTSPAAISMHHAYRNGLLEHSLHLARCVKALLPLYPEINEDLALAGALLHDIGKTEEYTQGLVTKKTQAGILYGHIIIGYRIFRKHALKNKVSPEIIERIEHIILSHQGKLEWGAAVLASTPEAVFISMIDNLDARMAMVQNAISNTPTGEDFSERILGLDNVALLVKPISTQ